MSQPVVQLDFVQMSQPVVQLDFVQMHQLGAHHRPMVDVVVVDLDIVGLGIVGLGLSIVGFGIVDLGFGLGFGLEGNIHAYVLFPLLLQQ